MCSPNRHRPSPPIEKFYPIELNVSTPSLNSPNFVIRFNENKVGMS